MDKSLDEFLEQLGISTLHKSNRESITWIPGEKKTISVAVS